jgi:excisionase family DNA binding protein
MVARIRGPLGLPTPRVRPSPGQVQLASRLTRWAVFFVTRQFYTLVSICPLLYNIGARRTTKEIATMQVVEETYYTLREVAEKLKVSRRTVYRWVQAKELPAYRLGGEFRITERDLERFLEARRTLGPQSEGE